jgi:predicted pyridoxine 5'-phosphate oxidase superfamily flavin-nucleotide-binding protein
MNWPSFPGVRKLKRQLLGRRSSSMYHDGNRALQDEFGSRRLADRLVQELSRNRFSDGDKLFVESSPFFFLATADGEGRPDCSFKGGVPGFACVIAPDLLVFPDYDGNGMFKSLGNIAVNPHVGLLFIRIGEKPGRLRINGRAEISRDDPLIAVTPGAQLLIRVTPVDIFPNCPRYIPHLELMAPSVYAPVAGAKPVEPAWKSSEALNDVVPPRKR